MLVNQLGTSYNWDFFSDARGRAANLHLIVGALDDLCVFGHVLSFWQFGINCCPILDNFGKKGGELFLARQQRALAVKQRYLYYSELFRVVGGMFVR